MSAKIIYGKEVAELLKKECKKEVETIIKNNSSPPSLTVVLVGENPASKVYVQNKHKTCLELGIKSEMILLAKETKENELLKIIQKLNNDKNVDGILVQLPLPKHISENKILQSINPLKDVDCFHPENIGLIFAATPRFMPCTPAGIMEMIRYEKINVAGKNAVIIGRSNIVGKPIAMLLLQSNATVTITHSHTKNIESVLKSADIIVAAVGMKHFVKKEMVKENAIIFDVGINRVDGKLYGDVDFNNILEKASYITAVPGGVGVMTIAILMQNTIKAYKLNNKR